MDQAIDNQLETTEARGIEVVHSFVYLRFLMTNSGKFGG